MEEMSPEMLVPEGNLAWVYWFVDAVHAGSVLLTRRLHTSNLI